MRLASVDGLGGPGKLFSSTAWRLSGDGGGNELGEESSKRIGSTMDESSDLWVEEEVEEVGEWMPDVFG